MPLTRAEKRAEKEAQFKHLFDTVLQLSATDVLYDVFRSNNFTCIEDIISIKDEGFEKLQFIDKNNKKISPLEPLVLRLRVVKAFYYHLKEKHSLEIIDWEDESVVTSEIFDDFRVSIYDPSAPTKPGTPVSLNRNQSNTTDQLPQSKPAKSLAAEFRRGIKREKSAYSVLKDERIWNSWKRKTIATMNAHGCQNIANPNYKPQTLDETLLLREQNNFMYDVFATILQTTMGAHYVTVHEDNRDAQLVWKDYSTYMKTSTSADIQIEELMTSLTSLRLSQNYRGTTQKFLIDWLDQMMQFEKLTPLEAHFSPTQKKALLQNAVQEFKAFTQVKTQEQIEIARGHGPLLFNQYVSLLLNVSSAYDKKFEMASNSTQKRLVNIHQQDQIYSYEYEEEDIYGWDTEMDDQYFGSYMIQASDRTNRRFRPSLPRSLWESMPKSDQQAWDQISIKTKWEIIKQLRQAGIASIMNKDNSTSSTHPSTTTGSENKGNKITFQTKVHEYSTNHDNSLKNNASLASPISELTHPSKTDSLLINAAKSNSNVTNEEKLHPADLRKFLSEDHSRKTSSGNSQSSPSKFKVNQHMQYQILSFAHDSKRGALVDRGANGSMAGADMRIVTTTDRSVDVCGIDNHEILGLKIVTAGGVVESNKGKIIVIIHQAAHVPNGKTILSSPQAEHFGTKVRDQSSKIDKDGQLIKTLDGFILPLNFVNGLPYLSIRPFTDREWETLPHIVLTSDVEWDPSILDGESDNFLNTVQDPNDMHVTDDDGISNFGMPNIVHANCVNMELNKSLFFSYRVNPNETKPSTHDIEALQRYFLHSSPEVIRRTLKATTQYAQAGWITNDITNTFKSPFPALNVRRRHESVATDTIFSDIPAIDDGSTCAQLFVGMSTKFCDVIGMKTDGQFVHALMDSIRKNGAMDKLVTDGGEALISAKVKNVLRHLCIKDWHSEPHYQHQNPSERRYNDVKRKLQMTLNSSGAPAHCWLLCLNYVVFIMNRTALQSIGWRTPYEKLTGNTPDISMIYRFCFYDKIYFKRDESRGGKSFPSQSNELVGRFVGFSEHAGHSMTYIVLAEDTNKIMYRS